jgi:regulatory protein
MKITAIRQQERRKDRYSVYLDGAYAFSLSVTTLLETKLASGQELNGTDVDAYKRLSAEDKLYNNALRYAAMRRRSQWEMEQYLQRKAASPDVAAQIMRRLRDLGFINDLDFAKAWVENRHLLKPTSRRKLQLELRAKHVHDGIIQQVLSDDETADSDELVALVARKRRQSRYQDNDKLMQYLARQGFSYDDIKQALEDVQGADV